MGERRHVMAVYPAAFHECSAGRQCREAVEFLWTARCGQVFATLSIVPSHPLGCTDVESPLLLWASVRELSLGSRGA